MPISYHFMRPMNIFLFCVKIVFLPDLIPFFADESI
ncbi:uncharacterized protein METZ01_LOCUS394674, partial [marine metagenome]